MQNLLPSPSLPKNIKIKITQSYDFVCCLYECETWSPTLGEERRLRVFENRALRRIFGPKIDEAQDNGENYVMRRLMICSRHQILFG